MDRTNPSPLSPDDVSRAVVLAQPDSDHSLRHIALVGDTYTALLDGSQTGGRYCLIDMHVPKLGGPPPHRHDFEETFVALEGEIEATFRDQTLVVRKGETLHIPANAPHSFVNRQNAPARLLCFCSPAGQEEYFLEVGVPVETRTSAPPPAGDEEAAALMKKAIERAPFYRSELLVP